MVRCLYKRLEKDNWAVSSKFSCISGRFASIWSDFAFSRFFPTGCFEGSDGVPPLLQRRRSILHGIFEIQIELNFCFASIFRCCTTRFVTRSRIFTTTTAKRPFGLRKKKQTAPFCRFLSLMNFLCLLLPFDRKWSHNRSFDSGISFPIALAALDPIFGTFLRFSEIQFFVFPPCTRAPHRFPLHFRN
jgi:hypothetical protein